MLAQEVRQLIDNFCQQKNGYQQLSDLAIQKKAALIKGDLKEIEGITKTERGIILGLGRLEENRIKAQSYLAEQIGVDSTKLSLSVLAEQLEEPLKGELMEVGTQLTDLLVNLREENKTNTQLIEQSLDYINYAVDLLTVVDEVPTYPNQGTGATAARLFDKKI